MSILRIVRDEAAGAWRSLQYDLDRRGTEAPRYPGYEWYEPATEDISGAVRPPRRLLAAGAFGVLALVGAAGTYVTVANSLDSVLNADAPAPRTAPEIPGVPSPEPSPAPSLLAQAPAAPNGTEAWTTSASRPLAETAGSSPTARGVATVTTRAGRTVEAAPTPVVPPLAGSPSLTGSPSGSPGTASGSPSFPVPTPTSPPLWPGSHGPGGHAPSHQPDQIPDWPDWPAWPDEEPDFPAAPPEIPESMTPAPGVDGTGPGSADGATGGPNTPKDVTDGTSRTNAGDKAGY